MTRSLFFFCRAHKEVLFFASPFFEAALSGNWAETGRPPSMSSVITISQPPSIPGDKGTHPAPTEMTFAPMDHDLDAEDADACVDTVQSETSATSESDGSDMGFVTTTNAKVKAVEKSLARLQGTQNCNPKQEEDKLSKSKVHAAQATIHRRNKPDGPDAVVVLKEERVRCVSCLYVDTHTHHVVHPGVHIPRFPQICLSTVRNKI
jgi:hypothetical protein